MKVLFKYGVLKPVSMKNGNNEAFEPNKNFARSYHFSSPKS